MLVAFLWLALVALTQGAWVQHHVGINGYTQSGSCVAMSASGRHILIGAAADNGPGYGTLSHYDLNGGNVNTLLHRHPGAFGSGTGSGCAISGDGFHYASYMDSFIEFYRHGVLTGIGNMNQHYLGRSMNLNIDGSVISFQSQNLLGGGVYDTEIGIYVYDGVNAHAQTSSWTLTQHTMSNSATEVIGYPVVMPMHVTRETPIPVYVPYHDSSGNVNRGFKFTKQVGVSGVVSTEFTPRFGNQRILYQVSRSGDVYAVIEPISQKIIIKNTTGDPSVFADGVIGDIMDMDMVISGTLTRVAVIDASFVLVLWNNQVVEKRLVNNVWTTANMVSLNGTVTSFEASEDGHHFIAGISGNNEVKIYSDNNLYFADALQYNKKPDGSSSSSNTGLIVGVTLGVILALGGCVYYWYYTRYVVTHNYISYRHL